MPTSSPVRALPYMFRVVPWTIVLLAAGGVLAAALLPPFAVLPLRAALYEGFHVVCHQLPERSFAVGGVPVALCHRCLGVVAGLVGGALTVPLLGGWRARLVRWEKPALAAALVLVSADWLLGASGVWINAPASRFATGLFVGLAAGYLLARTVAAPAPEEILSQPHPAAAR